MRPQSWYGNWKDLSQPANVCGAVSPWRMGAGGAGLGVGIGGKSCLKLVVLNSKNQLVKHQ